MRVTFTIVAENVDDAAPAEAFDELAASLLDTIEADWPDIPLRSWPAKCTVDLDRGEPTA